MIYKESVIPKFVWDFVKKVVRNPVRSGILALLIAGFLKGKTESLNKNYLHTLREMVDRQQKLKPFILRFQDWNDSKKFIDVEITASSLLDAKTKAIKIAKTKLASPQFYKVIEESVSEDWIKDERVWDKAKSAFKKEYGKEPKASEDWAIVTSIYKKMGGRIDSEAVKMAESLFNKTSEDGEEEIDRNLSEASFDIKPFLKIKDELKSLDEVTRWVKSNNYNKHGYCQTIAALYDYIKPGKGIATRGHIAYIDGNNVYDPINFNNVVSKDEWVKKFPDYEIKNLIKMKREGFMMKSIIEQLQKLSLKEEYKVGDYVIGKDREEYKLISRKSDGWNVKRRNSDSIGYLADSAIKSLAHSEESFSEDFKIGDKVSALNGYKIGTIVKITSDYINIKDIDGKISSFNKNDIKKESLSTEILKEAVQNLDFNGKQLKKHDQIKVHPQVTSLPNPKIRGQSGKVTKIVDEDTVEINIDGKTYLMQSDTLIKESLSTESLKKITNNLGMKFGGYIKPDDPRIKNLDVGIGDIVSDGTKYFAIEESLSTIEQLQKLSLKEGTWKLGSKREIQKAASDINFLSKKLYNIVGDDEFMDALDRAKQRAEELAKQVD